MMDIAVILLIGVGGCWLFISPVVWIYWHFNREVRARNEKYTYTVFCGTLIFLTALIGEGLNILLFFIPSSWGHFDEDGDFVTMRRSIGYTVGLFAAMAIMQLMNKKESLEEQNKRMRRELEIRRRLDDLRNQTPSVKRAKIAEYQSQVRRFKDSAYLTDQEKETLGILEEVVWKENDL